MWDPAHIISSGHGVVCCRHERGAMMDFKITDAYFEDLKRRRHRQEKKLEERRGGKAARSDARRQQPQANKSQQKTA
jgi:hypothetical protein